MLTRVAFTFSELALWMLAFAMLIGCRDETALIPRDVLFGNPQRAQARLSPDGKYLSFLAPVDGVLNVWVGPADDIVEGQAGDRGKGPPHPQPRLGLRLASTSSIRRTRTATRTSTSTPPTSKPRETKDLTPIDGVRAEIQEISQKFPQRNPGRPQRPRPAAARHLAGEHRHGREEARAAESGRRRLPDRRRLQRPPGAQLHAARAARCGSCPRAKATRKKWKDVPGIRPRGRDDQRPGRLRQDRRARSTSKTAATATRPACSR